jgi:hypothetical protein
MLEIKAIDLSLQNTILQYTINPQIIANSNVSSTYYPRRLVK